MGLFNKKVKRQHYLSQVTDYIHLGKRFEQMAEKGWLVTDFNGSLATYEQCEPMDLEFDVVIYQPSNPKNVEYTNGVIELKERALERGWDYCTSNRQYIIFSKERQSSTEPIYDDEFSRYEDTRKAYWKAEGGHLVLILLFIAIVVLNNSMDRIDIYLTNTHVIVNVIMISGIVSFLAIILPQWYWLIHNGQRLNDGKPIVHASTIFIRNRNLWVVVFFLLMGIGIILYTSSLSGKGTSSFEGILDYIPTIIGVTIGMTVGNIVRDEGNVLRGLIGSTLLFASVIIGSLIVSNLYVGITDIDTQEKEVALVSERLPFVSNLKVDKGLFINRIQSSYYAPINFEVSVFSKNDQVTQIKFLRYIEAKDIDTAVMLMKQKIGDARSYQSKAIKGEENIDGLYDADYIVPMELIDETAYYLSPHKQFVIIQKDNILMEVSIDGDFSEKATRDSVMRQLFKAHQLTSPPELHIIIGNKSYTSCKGGYSWSIDIGDGTRRVTEADTAGLKSIAGHCPPLSLDEEDRFLLEFEVEPISYQIHTWKPDEGETIAEGFDQSNEIYEVNATWSQGEAQYVFVIASE